MKRLFFGIAALTLTLMVAGEVLAQRGGGGPGGRPGQGGRGGRPGGPGGFGGRFTRPKPGQVLPEFLQERLKLTAEQKKALAALQKEVDGKLRKLLTEEQQKMLKEMGQRGRGQFGPGGPGGRGGRPGGPGGRPGQVGGDILKRLMSFDKNKDGKLSKNEVPEATQERLFGRADGNNDGVIDQKELEKMAEEFRGRGFGRRGGRPGVGGRPEGGRPEADQPKKGAGRPKGGI
ncbi:MAG: hypothetical protein ACFCD0_26710 [Gemmataceae bacterium]